MEELIKCPKCQSTQLSANKKGFSGTKAVGGAILTGGIGLLAGTLGSNKIILTCLNCGNQFKAGSQKKYPQNMNINNQKMNESLNQNIKNMKVFFQYFIGIIFILVGVFNFTENGFVASLLNVFIGVLFIPYTFNLIASKINIKRIARVITIIVMFIISQVIISNNEDEKLKESTIAKNKLLAKDVIHATSYIAQMSREELNSLEKGTYFKDKKLNDEFIVLLKELRPLYLKEWDKKDSIRIIEDKLRLEEEKRWNSSRAGKISKRHPSWSKEDCESIANGEIWIGMEFDMVKELRGLPDKVNTSNYGHGNQYQACWDNYEISYFYFGEDGIITSYN